MSDKPRVHLRSFLSHRNAFGGPRSSLPTSPAKTPHPTPYTGLFFTPLQWAFVFLHTLAPSPDLCVRFLTHTLIIDKLALPLALALGVIP